MTCLPSSRLVNQCVLRQSARKVTLKDSTDALFGRFAGPREVDLHTILVRPQVHDLAGELRSVVTGQVEVVRIPAHWITPAVEHHALQVVGQDRFTDSADIVKGMHQAGEESLEVLAQGELHVAHPRVTQGQGKTIEPMPLPVAEVSPVELALLAR